MKTIKLLSPTQLSTAIQCLESTPLDGKWECVVREVKRNRSSSQHRLWWVWMTEYGKHFGMMKEEAHEYFKDRFLVNIYERDDEEFAAMIEAVRDVHRSGLKDKAKYLRKEVAKLTSTTKCTVEQMTELLNLVEMDSAQNGCVLSRPEDLYRESLGV